MVGLEGVVFLVLICLGAWLIYRALIKTRELTFHQQNFLMAVTHELKTPLASIKLYLDSLQSPKIPNDKKVAILPKMGEDLGRLQKLVENILDAGRFERSGYRLKKTSFSFSRLVNDVLDTTDKVPSHKPLKIERSIQDGIEVFGDRTALSRAISAVLENSLKYNNEDEVRIDAQLTKDNETITLRISDNGVGLGAGDLKAVFNRFYRVGQELQREYSGTGLGLYLCREIIRAHGGEITASSGGPGKGTTFTVIMKANRHENDTPR
jgi:signal transduction histidine kinase